MTPPENLPLRILSLEDSEFDAELIQRALEKGGIECVWRRVETRTAYEEALADFHPELILADFKLPTFDGARAVEIAQERCRDVPVIVISGTVGEEAAVDLLKQGATDFVLKDRLTRLVPAVRRALREVEEHQARQRAERDLRLLNEELERRVLERTHELQAKNAVMEEELEMARELQMALLPRHFPTLPQGTTSANSAVRFCSMYLPTGSVGGDFFNVARVSDTAVGVFICDVMGHGVRAALVTAMMRGLEEQLSAAAEDPGQLLTAINRALWGILRQTGTNLFATACYLVADLASSRITFANAGHPSPLLVRSSSCSVEPIMRPGGGGPALGIFEDARYSTHERDLAASDLILFFTDGLFEVENLSDEAFNESRLRESIRARAGLPPAQLVQEVFHEVERFAEGRAFADDVCFLGMEIAHLPAPGA
jgi:serine phosphatase RsbU (regulator of sigma subunit)